ncbi:MAG: ABC transporter permease [Bacillati bacterium ANGP1]|uniref:ABC transporter permease n=1 Tax=Candidatus Segetimicrobium genomatis TaxID=2569760 RepID=A0A537JKM0_9BACT|nr:MAG: ABC transporter permease [Terrabacteria group bacterium ANGP1]
MGSFIVRRILIGIPVLVGITIVGFVILSLAPGDPVSGLVDPERLATMSPAQLQQLRRELGLEGPMTVRYCRWLGACSPRGRGTGMVLSDHGLPNFFPAPLGGGSNGILHGDFGYSIKSGRPIIEEVVPRVEPTLVLMGISLLLAAGVGISFGIVSAVRQYGTLDYFLTTITLMMISTPTFVLGLIFLYVFGVSLRLLPVGGMYTLGLEFDLGDRLGHLVMPATILGLANAAPLLRYVRTSMLEVLNSDYIRTAQAKGLIARAVLLRHGLRNALLPVITVVALLLPDVVGGAIITEQVFSWPGMGLLAVRAAQDRDPSLMMAIVLMVGAAVLGSNLLADVAYGVADPRVRYD